MTTGQIVVMGRKTFEAIGKPLPNRETIVLSRSGFAYPGIRVVNDLGELDPAQESRTMFICGGAQIYAQALPLCTDLYLTHVQRTVKGDTLFPPFEDGFTPVATLAENADFRIVHYRRR
jgi:dihydrofolate reductase